MRDRHIQSVERAMALLEQLNAIPGGSGLAHLCQITGLSKSTAHGLLGTLVDLGYVLNEGNRYRIGPRTLHLAPTPGKTTDLIRELFTPALLAFNDICERNSHLTIPCGTRAYLTLEGLDPLGARISTSIDTRRDAIRTSAVGKIFLAHDLSFIRRVRRNAPLGHDLERELLHVSDSGYAFDRGDSRPGLHCMAIPLRHQGMLVGALSISGADEEMEPGWMEVKAREVQRELGSMVSL